MGLFKSRNHFPVNGRTVVITGGSQGMGKGVAKQLAKKGANVVIVARNVEKLKVALESIKNEAIHPETQRFTYISADLINPEDSVRVMREVKAWNSNTAPDIVWCVAGGTHPDFFINMDTHQLREDMDQNYYSASFMAHATLREWLQPSKNSEAKLPSSSEKPRHLIFTSSIVAFYSMVGYSQYAPAKTALRALSDALSQELQVYNGARRRKGSPSPEADVKVHTVFPATIFTPGYEEENLTKPAILKKLEESDGGQTEDEVATASIRGLERGDYLVTTTWLGSLMRSSAWGGSPRNSWIVDPVFSWLSSIVWPFAQSDMDRTVFKWGKENGLPPKA
ncbi:MAG: 3-dehydrosphinganine reductase [Chaenotheca gracillima]|nr:MAG: 3-dehydrosphinganine reductase [Chaenotheca gracillima]